MLKQRIITALLLLPVFLSGLFATSAIGFAWFIGLIVAIAAWEWARMGGLQLQWQRVAYAAGIIAVLLAGRHIPPAASLVVAFAGWCVAVVLVARWPVGQSIWSRPMTRLLTGVVLLHSTWVALLYLRSATWTLEPEVPGVYLILYVFLIVWLADIGAYFVGRTWGRRKLAPLVSPGKSIEGAMGGLAAVSVLPLVGGVWFGLEGASIALLWIVTLITAVFSIAGDLLESLAKRSAGIKDSSQILPGHGGIMDRIDSVTAAAPVFGFLMLVLGWLTVSVSGVN